MKQKVKKIAVGILGGIVLAIGILMIVLPGPAFLVIPAGLAILSTEFVFAQRIKSRCEDRFQRWREQHKKRKAAKRARAHTI